MLRDGDWVHVVPTEGPLLPPEPHGCAAESRALADAYAAGRLASPDPGDGSAAWASAVPECIQTLGGHQDDVQGLAALGCDFLASCAYDRTVRVWDVVAGRCVCTFEDSEAVGAVVALGVDARRIAAGSGRRDVKVWDLAEQRCARTLSGHGGLVNGLAALGPDRLASCSEDRTVKIWDVAGGRCAATLRGHEDEVFGIVSLEAPEPRGRLASCALDGAVKVWDVSRQACISNLKGHADEAYAVASLGGELLASSSLDRTIRVWDLRGGECARLLQDESSVYCLAGLSAGVVASGSFAQEIRLWDIGDGRCIRALRGHGSGVRAVVRLGPDRLATGSCDRSVKVWTVADA